MFALSLRLNRRYAKRGEAATVAGAYQPRCVAVSNHRSAFRSHLDYRGSPMNKFGMLVAGVIAFSSSANAYDYKVGALEIDHPWSRAVPKGATVSTPVAGKFEIHEMSMDKGVMRMRPVPAGIVIKPGETVELKPQSIHIMMTGLKQPIEKGKPFKGSLVFEKAGPVEVDFAVEGVGATPAAAHDMHNTHH